MPQEMERANIETAYTYTIHKVRLQYLPTNQSVIKLADSDVNWTASQMLNHHQVQQEEEHEQVFVHYLCIENYHS